MPPYKSTPEGWRLPPEGKEKFLADLQRIMAGWEEVNKKYRERRGLPVHEKQEFSLPPLPWFVQSLEDRGTNIVFAVAETFDGGLVMLRWDPKPKDWGEWTTCPLWKFWEAGVWLSDDEAEELIGWPPVEFLRKANGVALY